MPLPELPRCRPGPLPGHVYLVGAGPGDPELFTLRGARLVGGADVVVYDNLVAPDIIELAPAGAERIYVGKKASDHTLPQDEINALMGFELPEDADLDTIGGFVFTEFGRVPAAGETITWQDTLRVTVLEASRRRVNRVRLERLPKEPLETGLSAISETTG